MKYRGTCLYALSELYFQPMGLRYALAIISGLLLSGGIRTSIGVLLTTGDLIRLSLWALIVLPYFD